MKKLVLSLVVGVLALTGAVLAPSASAQDPTPSCSQALIKQQELQRQHDAAVAADKAVADAQALYDTLDKARVELAAAIAADNATVPPLTEDSQRTKDAKAAVAKAEASVKAFEAKGVSIEALRAEAAKADAAALKVLLDAAAKVADTACKGKPGEPAPKDVDCDEVTRAEAQRILNLDLSDPNNLDVDGDGIACEVDQVRVVPRTSSGVDTGA